jgi:peptidylprolyl isomerase
MMGLIGIGREFSLFLKSNALLDPSMRLLSAGGVGRVASIGFLLGTFSVAVKAAPATTNAPPAAKAPAPKTPAPKTPATNAPATNAPAAAAPNVELDKESGKPVITNPSGLKYVDLVEGTGAQVKQGDHVAVKYLGKLTDGSKFDSSADHPEMGPAFNYVQGVTELIPGWTEGVSTMKVGGKRKLIIPPQLGYGLQGYGDVIPPNATLIFEIELVAINNPPAPSTK